MPALSIPPLRRLFARLLFLSFLALIIFAFSPHPAALAEEAEEAPPPPTQLVLSDVNPLQPPDTSSPRATIKSFVNLTKEFEEAYGQVKSGRSRA
jgi:hypothetical protein